MKRAFLFCCYFIFVNIQTSIAEGKLTLFVRPVFHQKPLVLNNQNYITDNGDTISIEVFKFYLSKLSLVADNKKSQDLKNIHLIDAEDSNSLVLHCDAIKPGVYHFLTFNIGVDSLANISGALDGFLDPSLGMYWAWNTGYINAKLEGKSSACKTLHQQFEFHIGGYQNPFITLRKIKLALDSFEIIDHSSMELTLEVELDRWFQGIHLFSLNHVVTPSVEAMKVADNYSDMFKLKEFAVHKK